MPIWGACLPLAEKLPFLPVMEALDALGRLDDGALLDSALASAPQYARAEAGRLLPRIFSDHEALGLARLQNDVLLALTARHTGTLFVTRDAHFESLRRHVPFTLKVLPH